MHLCGQIARAALLMIAHASHAGSQNQKEATASLSLQIVETAVLCRRNANGARKARCASHIIAHASSCAGSQKQKASDYLSQSSNCGTNWIYPGKMVTVLAKLTAHPFCMIARTAQTGSAN